MTVTEYLTRQAWLAVVFCVVVPLLGTWTLVQGISAGEG
jgi:hypothetical protein